MKNINDTPIRTRCDCGRAVKNHHLLCDKCFGRRDKRRIAVMRMKLVAQQKKAKLKKKPYKNRGEQCAKCDRMVNTNKEGFCFECWEENKCIKEQIK